MLPTMYEIHRYDRPYLDDREIGIEIEMEGGNLSLPYNRTWSCARDGSLRGNSIEYILSKPVPIDKVGAALKKLVKLGAENEDREEAIHEPSDRCGVHVHVNCQLLNFNQVFNFILLYLVMERVLMSYCGESREGNLYCLRACDAEYFTDAMIRTKRTSNLDHIAAARDGGLKYSSVNPESLYRFGTVEFRGLRTPKNILDIEEWVHILCMLKKKSLLIKDPIALVENFSQQGEAGFFDEIMGKWAPVLREKVRDVDDKVLQGIRLAQDIAYTPTVTLPKTKEQMFEARPVNYAVNPDIWREE